MALPTISVITLTRARIGLLCRAMRSVVGQDFAGCIEHIVIGDDCPFLADNLEQIQGVNPAVIV